MQARDSGVEALLDVIMHKAGLPTEATDKIDDIEVLSQGMEVMWLLGRSASSKDAEGEQAEAKARSRQEGGPAPYPRPAATRSPRARAAPLLAGLRESQVLDG